MTVPSSDLAAPRTHTRRLGALAAIVLVALAVPWFAAARFHTLGAARGDDWSYLRTLFTWVDHGHLNFNNWVSMSLLGQLVVATPVVVVRGHDIAMLQVLVAIVGTIGTVVALAVGTRLSQRRSVGLLVALTVAAGPVWGVLAIGFMTDVPAFAAGAVTILFAVRHLQEHRRRDLYLATAIGLFAFTIREYAAVPLVAALIAAAVSARVRGDRATVRRIVDLAIASLVVVVVFTALWRQIPDSKPFTPAFPTEHSLKNLLYKGAGMVRLLGLWLLPAIAIRGPLDIVRKAWRTSSDTTVFATLGVAGWLAYTGYSAPRIGFAGNYVVPDGALSIGVSAGGRPDIIAAWLFGVLIVIGSIGATLLALAALSGLIDAYRAWRNRDTHEPDVIALYLGLILVGYGAAYSVAAATGLPLYDRYVLPIVLPSALLLTRHRASSASVRSTTAPAWLFLAGLLALSATYTFDSASFDAARWNVSKAVTGQGWDPRDIGGNFEWANFYGDKPGTGIRATQRFCVKVFVGTPPNRKDRTAPELARGWYEPPFGPRIAVRALLIDPSCVPTRTGATASSAPRRP